MLKRLLVSTLLENALYLGYHRRFTHPSMFLYLVGSRRTVDIHNLHLAVLYINKVLALFWLVWQQFSCIWIIAPAINKYFSAIKKFTGSMLMDDLLYFWQKKWISGLFTNNSTFLASSQSILTFPSLIFYLSQSENFTHFREAATSAILQAGLADSTSTVQFYDYLINANEKTRKTKAYFIDLILAQGNKYIHYNKKNFLFTL